MADEVGAASEFIYGRLTNPGGALASTAAQLVGMVTGFYEDAAPEGATFPLVVYSLLSGTDQVAQGDVRVFTSPLMLVKAISQSESEAQAGQIYGLVDTLLQDGYGYVTLNGMQYWIGRCNRTAVVKYPEQRGDARYNHMGGKYEMLVQPSPIVVPVALSYPYA